MSGTIPLSLTQQFDVYGQPLSGGQLYLIQAGTVSTPQDGFQDSALTIKMPYPITLDAAGRIPQFFLADGYIKVRLQDTAGVVQLAADSVLVIGPSAGGGGGSTVDPTQLIQTGNIITRYGTGTLAGYVRLNSLTIGSAVSGATERANADCQALFQYLWAANAALPVSGGRGVSAAADWTANKQITLPDLRGRVIAGLDDMGNAFANRLGSTVFSTTLGGSNASGGGNNQTYTIATANLPAYTPSGSVSSSGSGSVNLPYNPGQGFNAGGGIVPYQRTAPSLNDLAAVVSFTVTSTFTGNSQGGTSTPFSIVQPTMTMTLYCKL